MSNEAKQKVLAIHKDAEAMDVLGEDGLWWICLSTPDSKCFCNEEAPGQCCWPETIGEGETEELAWLDAVKKLEAVHAAK